jgi:catechol 2,3-dioxygenase
MSQPTSIATPNAAAPATTEDRITYGAVHLDVVDADRSLGFWRDLVGLAELGSSEDEVRLGAGGRELIVLHPGAARGAVRGHAGLYHVALHVPGELELARVIARLAAHRVQQGPTDHVFSKATYVTDPDGLMLELTAETPERVSRVEVRPGSVALYDTDGRVRAPTEPLELEPLLALLGDGPIDVPLPDGTFVGHVHLHVPDMDAAVAFYRDTIGFEEHMVMPTIGMADLGAGGSFPHRIAVNVWSGPGATQPPAGTAGLRSFELFVRDQPALDTIRERLGAPAGPNVAATDPAGNAFSVRAQRAG